MGTSAETSAAAAGGTNAGLIGGVVGGVVGAIALGLAGFFIWFRRRKRGGKASAERLASQTGEEEKPGEPGPGPEPGASELAGRGMAKSPLWGGTAELQGHGHGQGDGAVSPLVSQEGDAKDAEVSGGWGGGSELPGSPGAGMQHMELQGSECGNASLHEASDGLGQGGFEMQAYPMGVDAARVDGPVYEMPAGDGRWDAHVR